MPCVICSDRFDSVVEIARTKCGHVFHSDCVCKWVDHSRTCPECRGIVFVSDVLNLHLNFPPNDYAARLKSEMWKIKSLLGKKDTQLLFAKERIKQLQLHMIFKNLDISKMQTHLKGLEFEYSLIRTKVGLRSLPSLVTELQRLKQENKRLSEEVEALNTKKTEKDEVPLVKKRRSELKLNKGVKESSTSSVNPSKLSTSSINSAAAKNGIEPGMHTDNCNHQEGKCTCLPSTISEK